MDKVPDPEPAIRNFQCNDKGENILVYKIEKKNQVGKTQNELARKGKAAKKLVKNSSKSERRKNGVLLRV